MNRAARTKLLIWVVVGLLMVGAFAITLAVSDPPPPKRFIMATGDPSGAYHAIAHRHRDLSKRIPGNSLGMLYAWRTHVNMVQAEALARLRELGGDAADIPSSPYGDSSFGSSVDNAA